jgi:lipid-binding SYLF domain-containing protein
MTTLLHRIVPVTFLALFAMAIGCQTTPDTQAKRDSLDKEADAALASFKANDPALASMINNAYGYAIFPGAGKGGLIVGGAYGRGTVTEQGKMIGYADLTQASIGAQIGGQSFSELILFETKPALDRFKANELAFTANASAVIVKTGVGAATKYENGVAVLIRPEAGAMADASVGGQKFTFVPLANANAVEAKHEVKSETETKTVEPSEKIETKTVTKEKI